MSNLYLVTGGAGFIGSHISTALIKRGDRVRVLDNLLTGHRHNLAHLEGKIEFIEGSICDTEITRQAMEGVKVVFHEAAIPSVPRSVANPRESHEANVNGTFNVLMAAKLQFHHTPNLKLQRPVFSRRLLSPPSTH